MGRPFDFGYGELFLEKKGLKFKDGKDGQDGTCTRRSSVDRGTLDL